jgi:hypothetical protein
MLSIELYSGDTPGTIEYLKLFYTSQSYSQQRNAEVLTDDNEPSRVFVSIPECSDGPAASCPIDKFFSLTAPGHGAIDPNCLAPEFESLVSPTDIPNPAPVASNRMYTASALAGSSIGSAVAGGAIVTAGGLMFTSAGRGVLARATGSVTTYETAADDPFIVAVQQEAASDTANI